MNIGKVFERNFVKCVPDYVGVIRIPDPAQSFSHASNLRFTRKNPYDFILWNPRTYTFYALELKTVKGKSISFERSEISIRSSAKRTAENPCFFIGK